MNLEEGKSLQDELNDVLPHFSLEGWRVVLIPDEKQTLGGQVLSEKKTILIFEKDPEKARDALIHEVVEIKLQPLMAEHQETVNGLIKIIEDLTDFDEESKEMINGLIKIIERLIYREKERVIKYLVPYLRYVFKDKKGGRDASV